MLGLHPDRSAVLAKGDLTRRASLQRDAALHHLFVCNNLRLRFKKFKSSNSNRFKTISESTKEIGARFLVFADKKSTPTGLGLVCMLHAVVQSMPTDVGGYIASKGTEHTRLTLISST